MANPGEIVEIKTKDKTYKGILMESSDSSTTVIKLDTGYNRGFDKKNVKSMKSLGKPKKKEAKAPAAKPKKGLKTISILHTGGTIAAQVDYETGAVTNRFTPEDIMKMFPELREIANIKSRLMRNMASDDMRFAHFNLMAKEIEKEIKDGTDGIIITQGTDFMHYTSAALAFILQNFPVPILVVGSQRSSDRGSSDAGMNLISAASIIANSDFCDVAICMHGSVNDDICWILPACKSRKMHTSRRDAFQPVNDRPWAEVQYSKGCKVKFLRDDYRQRAKDRKLELKLINEKLKIGIIKAHPQMFAKEFECYEGFDGLVLEGSGLGHFPITEIDEFTKENKRIFNAINKLAKKMPVVMSPQTIYGRIQMNVYRPARQLLELGVLGNYSDMTPETTLVKLAWLLSNDPKHVKERMGENIIGELNKRVGTEFI